MRIKSRWRDGSVEITNKSGILVLKFLNNMIELRPRAIYVEDTIDHRVGSGNRRKYIYVYYNVLKPLPFQPSIRVRDIDEFTVENYVIRYTRSLIDEYYTIITPGTHLYDYVIITSDELGIILSSRREAYFDKTDSALTIYLV